MNEWTQREEGREDVEREGCWEGGRVGCRQFRVLDIPEGVGYDRGEWLAKDPSSSRTEVSGRYAISCEE